MADEAHREEWMTDDQWACAQMLADWSGGFHHVTGTIKPASPKGIKCSVPHGSMSSFDFDGLTRLVVMAHDRCIRAELRSGGPQRLTMYLHKRQRDGQMAQRHPTLDQAIAAIR
jgi:hypothetical protein